MRCPSCELENEEGAFYCARCHTALPRPLAPGECPYCGRLPQPGELPQAVCPSCGNDPERGKEVRAKRVAALRAEVEVQTGQLEAQRQALLARKTKKGCGLTLLLLAVGVGYLTTHLRAQPAAPLPSAPEKRSVLYVGRAMSKNRRTKVLRYRTLRAVCPADTYQVEVK